MDVAVTGGLYKNEIDYIFCSHKYIVQDVSVLNNFYTGSDYRLIRAKVSISAKLQRYLTLKKGNSKEVDPLKLLINADVYSSNLNEKLSELRPESLDINTLNQKLNKTMMEAALAVAKKNYSREGKLSSEAKALLQERRDMIKAGRKETVDFKEICKKTRKTVEEDIEKFKEKTVRRSSGNTEAKSVR